MQKNNYNPYVKQWGNNGEIIVFVHYFGGSANCWKWVAEGLSDHFTCIAFNLPGCGHTKPLPQISTVIYAAFIAARLKMMNVHPYTVIGHSMGGKIATQLALSVPDNVKQLLLVAPSPPGREHILPKNKKQLLHVKDETTAKKIIDGATVIQLQGEALQVAMDAQLATTQQVRDWWVSTGSQQPLVLDEVYKIATPVTILSSVEDAAIAYETIQQDVVPAFKNATLETAKNVGHLIPLENPEIIIATIKKLFHT